MLRYLDKYLFLALGLIATSYGFRRTSRRDSTKPYKALKPGDKLVPREGYQGLVDSWVEDAAREAYTPNEAPSLCFQDFIKKMTEHYNGSVAGTATGRRRGGHRPNRVNIESIANRWGDNEVLMTDARGRVTRFYVSKTGEISRVDGSRRSGSLRRARTSMRTPSPKGMTSPVSPKPGAVAPSPKPGAVASPSPRVGRVSQRRSTTSMRRSGSGKSGGSGKSAKSVTAEPEPGVPIEEWPPIPQHFLRQTKESNFLTKGGEGSIFKVKCEDESRCILKRIDRKASASALRRVSMEIDIMLMLKDKHIMRVYQRYQSPDFLYYTMPLAPYGDGKSMMGKVRDYFRGYDGYKQDRELVAKVMMRDIVRGFIKMHESGYIHHDVKWDNTLVFKTRIVVHDFGMTMPLKRGAETKEWGTLQTLPPETFDRPAQYDDRGDIWSIGVMLFEILMGYNPFRPVKLTKTGDKKKDRKRFNEVLIKNIIETDAIELSDDYSPECRDLLSKMVCPLEQRINTIHDVADHPWFDEIRRFKIEIRSSPYVFVGNNEPLERTKALLHGIRNSGKKHRRHKKKG